MSGFIRIENSEIRRYERLIAQKALHNIHDPADHAGCFMSASHLNQIIPDDRNDVLYLIMYKLVITNWTVCDGGIQYG